MALRKKLFRLISRDHGWASRLYEWFMLVMIIASVVPLMFIEYHPVFKVIENVTVTLTTVGYGDLCPVTDVGRVVSMLSSIFGVAIIALPSGAITARYLEELQHTRKKSEQQQ